MNVAEYRAHPSLNFSLAKHLLKSPAHFKAAQDADEQEESEALAIGKLAHSMTLEGKDLRSLYAIKPAGMSFATKEGKAWRDAQTLPILKEDSADSIPQIADAITKNPDAAKILGACGFRETPIFGNLMGVPCKALLDVHGSVKGTWAITDFKTDKDVEARSFKKTVYDRHYDLQMSWYSSLLALEHGLEERPFWTWIAAEKKAPWFNVVYYPTQSFIESGERKLERVLTLYNECMESGKWPFAVTGMQELEPPSWAEKDARPVWNAEGTL